MSIHNICFHGKMRKILLILLIFLSYGETIKVFIVLHFSSSGITDTSLLTPKRKKFFYFPHINATRLLQDIRCWIINLPESPTYFYFREDQKNESHCCSCSLRGLCPEYGMLLCKCRADQ